MSDLTEQYAAEMVKLDAVVEVLGIADSYENPADCIKSWIVRAEAAKARCKRLERVLRNAMQCFGDEEGESAEAILADMRDTLSDTAQQETDEPRTYVNRRAIDMD